MEKQLELELPVEYANSDQYRESLAEYTKCIQAGLKNVFLFYCGTTKKFSVSRWWNRETIESYKTNQIIK